MLELNRTYMWDCLNIMKELPDNSVDLVCVDPPYWISFWNNNWDKINDFISFTDSRVSEVFRVLRQGGSFYWFMTRINVSEFKQICDKYWKIKNWITWERIKWRANSHNYKSTKEEILYYVKGEGETRNEEKMLKLHITPYMKDGKPRGWFTNEDWIKCRRTGIWNVWHYTTPFFSMMEYNDHPTQKPELMIERIILSSSNEWDIILDPFAWSGTIWAVAKKLWRNFIMIEKDADYFQIAEDRLNNIKDVNLFSNK